MMTRLVVSCVSWTIPFSIHAWLGFGPARILYIDDVRCGEAWPEGVMNPGPQPSGSVFQRKKIRSSVAGIMDLLVALMAAFLVDSSMILSSNNSKDF